MNVNRHYSLLSNPSVAEDAKVEDLALVKFFEGHVQNVHPFFGRVAPGTRKDGTTGTERLYHAVCAVGVSRDGMTEGC